MEDPSRGHAVFRGCAGQIARRARPAGGIGTNAQDTACEKAVSRGGRRMGKRGIQPRMPGKVHTNEKGSSDLRIGVSIS